MLCLALKQAKTSGSGTALSCSAILIRTKIFDMNTQNKLDKSFGPVGSSAGIFMAIVGIIASYTTLFGLIFVVVGCFLGFTSTCTIIDFEKKRIKFSENLFGIIKTGKWIQIDDRMKIGIKNSNLVWRAFSQGNRSVDIGADDFRLILYDAENNEIMPVKKTGSLGLAIAEQELLCEKLNLSPFE